MGFMNREIWENYLNSLESKRQQIIDVFKDRSNFSKLMSGRVSIFNNNIYYGKIPHSRYWKNYNYTVDPLDREEQFSKDNVIATTNELILQKKYRDLGIMSVEHIAIPNEKQQNQKKTFVPHAVVSQFNFDKNTQIITLSDFLNADKASIYQLIQDPTTTIFTDYKDFEFPVFWGDLEYLLKKKDIYLKFMTKHCYDQIIQSLISSVFEFGDDEHLNNYLLCKKVDSPKFEELCVIDKESTAFCPHIVQDLSWEGIKAYTYNFSEYNSNSISIGGATNFYERYNVLLNMILDGKLDKKYYYFLQKIANTNYDKLAQNTYEESGIKPIQTQIDMFKVGSEKAGRLYNLQPFNEDNLKHYFTL